MGSWRRGDGNTIQSEVDALEASVEDIGTKPKQKKAEVVEVDSDGRELIDLTLSDSEPDSDRGFSEPDEDDIPIEGETPPASPVPDLRLVAPAETDRTILLAPLKTYLKSDRLGIGATRHPSSSSSKPSTSSDSVSASQITPSNSLQGPRLKRKPFTDTSQAMYTYKELREAKRHRRFEELRNKGKSQRKRGSRGFANTTKEENQRRKDMLAYMNS